MEQGVLFETDRELPVISYSKLNRFLTCPFRYEKEYIEKKIGMNRDRHYLFGLSLHQALAKYMSIGLVPFDINEFREILKSYWHDIEYRDEFGTPETCEEAFEKAVLMIGEMADNPYLNRQPKLVETRFRVQNKYAILTGSIDRVDITGDILEIIDYKSRNKDKTEKEVKADFQWYFYWYGCRKLTGQAPVRMTFIYLDKADVLSFDITDEMVKRKDVEFEKSMEKLIATNDFKPNRNEWCHNCRFEKECGINLSYD